MNTRDDISTAMIDRFIDEAIAESDIRAEAAELWRHEMRRLVRGRIRQMFRPVDYDLD